MPPTDEQRAYRDRTRAAQVGISPEEYGGRLDAMRTPEYTKAAFGGPNNTVSPELIAHQKAGGTFEQYLGSNYEFLDRGGLGARGSRPGFAGVSPGIQAPGGATGPAGPPMGGGAGGRNMALPPPGQRGPSAAYSGAIGQPAQAGAPAGNAMAGVAGSAAATGGKGFAGVRPMTPAPGRGLRTSFGAAGR